MSQSEKSYWVFSPPAPPGNLRRLRGIKAPRATCPVRAREMSRLRRPKASRRAVRRFAGAAGRATSAAIRTRPGRHDHDAIGQEHGLGDRMGDEQDGLAGLARRSPRPDAQQFEPHVVAGHGVERAERLVHQQQSGIEQQRPAKRGALLHAAESSRGRFGGEAREAGHGEQLVRPCSQAARVLASPARRGAARLQDRPPAQQGWSAWNTMPTSGIGAHRARKPTVPRLAGRNPATMRNKVDCRSRSVPTSETNSPAPTDNEIPGEGLDRAARRRVCHVDPVEVDQGPGPTRVGSTSACRP